MSNLFDLDDENDELFKPNQAKKKPSRDLDDLFGTGTKAPAKSDTLDDILAPNVEEDLFNSAIATSKSTASDDDLDDLLNAQPSSTVPGSGDMKPKKNKTVNLFDNDVDDELDIFGLGISSGKSSNAQSEPINDDDLFGFGLDNKADNDLMFTNDTKQNKSPEVTGDLLLDMNPESSALSPNVAVNGLVMDTEQDGKKNNKLDIFDEQTQPLFVTKSDDLVDLLGVNEIKTENQSSSASRIRADSLDMLLDEQPTSMIPGNDDLMSMIEADVKPKERKPVQRKLSKLNRKSRNVNVDKSDAKKEPKSLDDMLDAQPDGMVSVSDDLSSMLEKNSDAVLDMQTESSDKQVSIALIESDLKNATKENDNVFDDQEVPIRDDGISTNVKQEVSEESLDNMLDAQPVGILSTNDHTNEIVSPDVAVNDLVVDASKDTEQDEKKNNKLDIFDEQTQLLSVTKSDDLVDLLGVNEIKTKSQSSSSSRTRADSLDMLLDEQPMSMIPGNDDLLSMVESDVKPKERKPVQRKPSKLKRKSRNVNVDKVETSQEPSNLDDMLDAQPDGMVSISEDLSSMIIKNSNSALDNLPESSDHLGSISLIESDVKKVIKENNTALPDQAVLDEDDGISTNIKQETSEDSLDKMLDAQPVGTLSPNDDIQSLVSPTEKPISMPLVKPHGKVDTVSKSADVTVDPTEISRPEQKSFNASSDQSNNDNAVEKSHGTTNDQSEDNLDMLLDAQPDNAVPSNDDLASLIMKKDTSSTESVVKARDRPSVRRKPSKLNRKSRNIDSNKSDTSKEPASLDDMLDAQPDGMVPVSDDLLSLVEPITNNATSSNKNATPELVRQASPTKETDLVDDLFGESDGNLIDDFEFIDDNLEVDKSSGDNIEEEETDKCDSETEDKQPEPTIPTSKRKTNLKKSMERSFEDLLNGLSDESEPELEDIIPDDIDNTNLERGLFYKSLLGSPDKSYRDIKPDTSVFTSKQIDDPFDMDSVVSSTPQMKITPPEVKVHTPEYEEEDYDISGNRDFVGANANVVDDDDDVQMRPKPTRKSTLSSGDDVDLEVIEDTNHLDVDVSKHKSALGKKGSLALRRKQSRKSRKSLLSTGEDAIFQDSTDAKQEPEMMNGDDEDETFGNKVDDDDDGYDLSPPAKKPSPVSMMPLPGLAGRPPSQRLSSSKPDDDDEDTKEVKRKSKPPPGAFVLPPMGVSPKKPLRPSSESNEKSPRESKPITFEKPALKSVKPKERSRSPVDDATPSYARVGLKSADKSDVEMKSASEERDVTFQKPSLRSTPKPNRDRTPDNKMDTNNGIFEKPALRNTCKPKSEQKQNHPEQEQDIFATKNLKSVPKPDIFTKDTSSDNHVFDKPHLKTTKCDGDSIKNEPSSKFDEKTFEKPTLRSTNKNLRSESTEDQGYEPSHVFEKPPLRTAGGRTAAVNKQDNFTSGMFEKPSLKKTTPSPEKEVKDIIEPKGTFDRPQLRKTDSLKEREERGRTPDKPSWLQKASDKHERALDALQSKENHSNSEKQLPSWLEKSPLKKNIGLPLQDTSNNQSTSSSQSDLSTEDYGKLPSTPRSRNSSQGTENEPERKASLPGLKGNNNYTPGWMRQARSPSVPGSGVIGPAKSMPALNESNEVPQWKKELAQRRQNRKEKTTEELSKKEDTAEPEWKKGIMLRKTRNTAQPSKETHSVEPEWKKAAEEKRQRLRNSAVDKTDH